MGSRRGGIGFVLLAMALLLLVAACSSKKKLVAPGPSAVAFEWMTAKMTLDLTAPGAEFNNITGTLRMRHDSVIWISASAFMGVESIRALVTPDTVTMVNRMDQTYLKEPLEAVAARYQWPTTIGEIQAKLLGDQAELRFGPYLLKLHYYDVKWDEPTTFPLKINKNYERIKL